MLVGARVYRVREDGERGTDLCVHVHVYKEAQENRAMWLHERNGEGGHSAYKQRKAGENLS